MDAEPVNCAGCGKVVWASEQKRALKKVWHKGCIKCTVCKILLSDKTLESYNNEPYCKAHLPQVRKGGGIQDMRTATGQGPLASANTKIEGTNQSTENNPDKSNISYPPNNPNQSTENNPDKSTVSYPPNSGNQSTENVPRQNQAPKQSSAPKPAVQTRSAPPPQQQQPKASIPVAPPAPPVPQEEQQEEAQEEQQQEEQQQEEQQQEETQQQGGYTVGTQCQAQYSADGQYYAAVIEQVENGQYLVRYTEYDETEWINEDQIQS